MTYVFWFLIAWSGCALVAIGIIFWDLFEGSAKHRAGLSSSTGNEGRFVAAVLLSIWPLTPLILLWWVARELLARRLRRRAEVTS